MSTTSLPETMKVPLFVGGRKIEFGQKPVPQPGAGQLLIKVQANALCGSERPQFLTGRKLRPATKRLGVVVAAEGN